MLEATGPCVTETVSMGTPPAAAGGAPQAGTYDLVSRTLYATPDAGDNMDDPRRETIVISNAVGHTFSVQVVQQSGTMIRRQGGMVVTAGTQLTFTATCPAGAGAGDGPQPYTATATSFTIYDTKDSGQTRLEKFMKR